MDLTKYIQITYEGLAFFMLFMAMMISTAPTALQMIPYYQFQSSALAVITFITALQFVGANPYESIFVFLFTAIPILLMLVIKPLLALATVPDEIPVFIRLFDPAIRRSTLQRAYPIRLARSPSPQMTLRSVGIDLL